MSERITCACGKSLGATPRGRIRRHTKLVPIPGSRFGVQGVNCEWGGRPAAEVIECAGDLRTARLIEAGRRRPAARRIITGDTGRDQCPPCNGWYPPDPRHCEAP